MSMLLATVTALINGSDMETSAAYGIRIMTYWAWGCVQRCDLWAWRRNEKRTETFMLGLLHNNRVSDKILYGSFRRRKRNNNIDTTTTTLRVMKVVARAEILKTDLVNLNLGSLGRRELSPR